MSLDPDKEDCLQVFAVASDFGSKIKGASKGPSAVYLSGLDKQLLARGLCSQWHWQHEHLNHHQVVASNIEAVSLTCNILAAGVQNVAAENKQFIVLGGDHSCAIGTWKGVMAVKPSLGLLWIDAHMDSHTPQTSHSHAIHGMPLASLLGYGDLSLVNLAGNDVLLQAENVHLVGVRSYEEEEAELLRQLGVVVHPMEEINRYGLDKVIGDALAAIQENTTGFGISLDLDAIDPVYAPGVSTPVAGGINPRELISALSGIAHEKHFIGMEIAELNPLQDKQSMTLALVNELLHAIFIGDRQ